MPFFSVVIPLYNKENFIAETLKSVLAQTFTDFEVIVVDDVSTDGSISVVEKIKDDRVRIIRHEKNKGLSASRNTGIKNADSEIIAFLDADDLWKEEFLESMADLSKKYPEASMYASKYEEVYNDIYVEHDFSAREGLINDFFINNLNQTIYYPSSLCVKKKAFDVIGLYDESITFAEDLDFNIRAHLALKMAYTNKPLMIYRMASENQITHAGLTNKVITDFDKYEALHPKRKDLKKYLDFHRYITAKLYKLSNNTQGYKKMLKGIDLSSLNYKQIALMYAPTFILRTIKKIKAVLIKKGINPTSY